VTLTPIDIATYTAPGNCSLSSDNSTILCDDKNGNIVNITVAEYNNWLSPQNVLGLCVDTANSNAVCL